MTSMDSDGAVSLNGRRFAMVSSTASRVDPDRPTEFRYHQQGQLTWGEYTGDTVTQGRFVGAFDGEVLAISFAHELAADRSVVRGSAESRVEVREGIVHLVETFFVDGVEHESVCVEV